MRSKETTDDSKLIRSYLEFVRKRAKDTDFHAEEKLKRIDELSEIISIARRDYQENKKA